VTRNVLNILEGSRLRFTCSLHNSIRVHSRQTRPRDTLCRHIRLMFGKRLDTILLRLGFAIPGFTAHTLSDSLWIYCFFTLESGFKSIRTRCRVRRMRVDRRRIWKEKVADSKISGHMWTSPQIYEMATCQ